MRWIVRHPTLGVVSPTLSALWRVSTDEARVLWDAAAALAGWRLQRERALRIDLDVLHEVPSAWPAPPVALRGGAGVGPDDLLRAGIAIAPGRLGAPAGAPLRAASARWRSRLGHAPAASLQPPWGRRWADPRRQGAPALDVGDLIRALPDRCAWSMAALDPRYVEGRITLREAFTGLRDRLGVRARAPGSVAPAYLEQIPDARLAEALAHGPGLLLSGPPGSGKRTLLQRLHVVAPDRGVNLDNHHGGGTPDPRYTARPAAVPLSVTPGLVCAWSQPTRESPALLRYAVELALDPAAGFQLVLSATEEAHARLLALAPALARWPTLSLSPPDDTALLPLWLCQRPWIEDLLGEPLDLAGILHRIPPARLRPLLSALDPNARTIPERGHAQRIDALLPATMPGRAPPRLRTSPAGAHRRLLRRSPDLAALIPSVDALIALIALDDALSGTAPRP